jgi:hypothetical protein
MAGQLPGSSRCWDDDHVPKGAYADKEKVAIEVVREAEIARGWQPGPILGQQAQHAEGCDLFSYPPDGGPAHAIEVKGWGEPLLRPDGSFTYPADVNAEQLERAKGDASWRLVIVANLDAVMAKTGEAEVLTLTSSDVIQRAVGWRYRVPLDGLQSSIET